MDLTEHHCTQEIHTKMQSCSTRRLRSDAERSRRCPSKIQKGIQHTTHRRTRWDVHYSAKTQLFKPLAATLGFPRKGRPQGDYLLCVASPENGLIRAGWVLYIQFYVVFTAHFFLHLMSQSCDHSQLLAFCGHGPFHRYVTYAFGSWNKNFIQ